MSFEIFVSCRPNAHLGIRLCGLGVSQPVNWSCLALWSHHMVKRFRNTTEAFTWSALIGHIVGVDSALKPRITSQWSSDRPASILNEVRPASPCLLFFYHSTSNPTISSTKLPLSYSNSSKYKAWISGTTGPSQILPPCTTHQANLTQPTFPFHITHHLSSVNYHLSISSPLLLTFSMVHASLIALIRSLISSISLIRRRKTDYSRFSPSNLTSRSTFS